MKDNNVTLYINTGTRKLPVTSSDSEVQFLIQATKKFQDELDIVHQTYPNDNPTNKILLTGIRIADAINLIEKDPKLYHAEIKRLSELTEKIESYASSFDLD